MMHQSRQSGAFLMARALLIVGILMAMLIIPVYLKKEREDRELAVRKTEAGDEPRPGDAACSGRSRHPSGQRHPCGRTAAAPRPLGHGLTFVAGLLMARRRLMWRA